MKSTLVPAAVLCLLASGCGQSLIQPKTAFEDDLEGGWAYRARPTAPVDDTHFGDFITGETGAHDYLYSSRTDAAVDPREPGDFIVYRFTGSHLEQPVIISQRVMSRKGNAVVVDQIIDDGVEPLELRLRIRDAAAGLNQIISVARLIDGVQLPFGTATYDALMAKVLPPVDATEKRLGSAQARIDVGGNVIDCEKTSYRVRVDGKPAFMTVMQSPHFVWGDIGGEIRDGHGKLLYKAEIVIMSGASAAPAPAAAEKAVARADDPYEDLDRLTELDSAARIELDPPEPAAPVAVHDEYEPYDDWDEFE